MLNIEIWVFVFIVKNEYFLKNKINFMKKEKKKVLKFLNKGFNIIKICFNNIFVV